MVKAYIFILGILVPLSWASFCPELEGKLDFKPEKFVGQWYYAAYNTNPNRPWQIKCAEFNVTSRQVENTGRHKLNYLFSYISNERKIYVTMHTESVDPELPGSFYSVGKRVQSDFWSDVHRAAIVATDYENYAVAILCSPVFRVDTKDFEASVWGYIWTRSRVLDDETFSVLKNVLIDHGVPKSTIQDSRNEENC
ncbi:uncharacterized protein LOC132205185 [Neocloeon triangulifer]|uniref:uncharacterized protein LOC132205185 n=1 Tax=Neocloeon triangulifer TaxID=2078957 RepID=UPI00286F5504|nr:uncharacterized protein LOC132205185 [Neocloeon triangulifer]